MPTLRTLLALGGLAYLGFYVYGLVTGVFSPFQVIALTTIAGVLIIGLGAYDIWYRRWKPEDGPEQVRAARSKRETRGF